MDLINQSESGGKTQVRGGAVFLAFFIMFTLGSLAVPVPLFPGNLATTLVPLSSTIQASLLSAIINGITYGILVWLVFVIATRNLDESGVASYEKKKNKEQRNSKRRAVKH